MFDSDDLDGKEWDLESRLEEVAAREYDNGTEHPSPEQLLMKLAIENLTSKQQRIWEMYAYAGMTQEDIAKELGIRQQAVTQQIQTIEKKIAAYCRQNRGAYMLLKLENKIMNEETR